MRCPYCGVDDDRVVDSRPAAEGVAIRRRRECLACASRFTTFERLELPELSVEKRSGTVAPFSPDKVLDGMVRAAKGRVPMELLEAAAQRVEQEIRQLRTPRVSSEQVGLAVLAQLRDLDDVSYMRFASVYKDFQGTEDFEHELHQLRKEAPPKT